MEASSDGGHAQGSDTVRTRRHKVAAAVALIALLAGGIALLQALDSYEEVLVTGPGLPFTGPELEWVEFDPDLKGEEGYPLFEPLGDGRVLLHLFPSGDSDDPGLNSRLLVTENGLEWSDVPIPPGFLYLNYDLSGDRWLVAGVYLSFGPEPADGEWEESDADFVIGYRAFFSDDRGANWTELAFDPSSSWVPTWPNYDYPSVHNPLALVSGDQMVIGLQREEEVADVGIDSDNGPTSGSEDDSGGNGKVHIFASDGGVLKEVAEFEGWLFPGSALSFGTVTGFTIQLYTHDGTERGPPRLLTLTSPDGRIWHEHDSGSIFAPTALGPDQSIWRAVWLGNSYGLQGLDPKGNLATEIVIDNSLPHGLAAGPSGLAVNAMTTPGTDLFALPRHRIVKGNYALWLNEPEGGFSLWDRTTYSKVYECSSEELWTWGHVYPGGPCQFIHPVNASDSLDSVVLVFEDEQTGAELAAFTREELAPVFPLWAISGLAVDSPEGEEQWLGWSADGAKWSWQTASDAFGIDSSVANDAVIKLAVGDGFVLAQAKLRSPQEPFFQDHWYIAQVP